MIEIKEIIIARIYLAKHENCFLCASKTIFCMREIETRMKKGDVILFDTQMDHVSEASIFLVDGQ